MRDIINVQKDEYGYSVYWGEYIRLEVGNGQREYAYHRAIELRALSKALTTLAEQGIELDNRSKEYLRLESSIKTLGYYYGGERKNEQLIADRAIELWKTGL